MSIVKWIKEAGTIDPDKIPLREVKNDEEVAKCIADFNKQWLNNDIDEPIILSFDSAGGSI